jgi:universal stress protein A
MLSTDTIPRGSELLNDEQATAGPVVVATDGSATSDPALLSALHLTQNTGSAVCVVAVHEMRALPSPELAAFPTMTEAEGAKREALRMLVESQVRRVAGGQNANWTIIVRDGDPATELARISAELRARMLVIGVRHRSLADRLFGRETALHLVQQCRVPLLVVPDGFAHMPRSALIAIDFSAASLEAGRIALGLFNSIWDVLLMHVTPSPIPPPQLFGTWQEWMDEDTTRGFEWAKSELSLAPNIKVETVSKEGHAAREIVAMAHDRRVDLIVTGSRGAGLLDRLLTGSTARGVVHGADCAVLVVRPPVQLDVPYPLLEPERKPIPREQWAKALAGFSERNLGRRTSMKIDDPQLGAHMQVQNYCLQGVAYDPGSQQVEIMVGDHAGAQRHLTRNISNVRSIQILPDASGVDWILRVANGDGQTLLTLHG